MARRSGLPKLKVKKFRLSKGKGRSSRRGAAY
jgi:hypothetical protein